MFSNSPLSGKLVVSSFLLAAFLIFNWWWFSYVPPLPDLIFASGRKSNRLRFHPARASTATTRDFCDLSDGNWVPDTRPPIYTNDTCEYIYPSQNCLQNQRPDRGYLYWQWKPTDCELPPFDSAYFLELMRGKKLVIIGDSIARNHMQSLLCALTQVDKPQNLYSDARSKEFTWHYPSYNFTLANIWSPFLVNYSVEQDVYKLHLDVPETKWTSQLAGYDVAIVSTGYWYFRPSMYYVNGTMIAGNSASKLNITIMKLIPVLQIVLESIFNYIAKEYKGIAMLRTVTVDHFEYGSWSTGGVCNRTMPYTQSNVPPPLPWMNNEINKVQIETFQHAAASSSNPLRHVIMNTTYSALLRPDGHPGPYRIQEPLEPVNDCLHWCLPGPIDMWNQLVLYHLQHGSLN